MARVARRGDRRQGQGARALPARAAHGTGARTRARSSPRWSRPTTSTRSRPNRSRGSRATRTSSAASARSCAGTRSRWSTARTIASTVSAVTSRRTRRRRRSYEVGFNHFFRGKGDGGFGDQIYFQGHAAPGHLRARVPRRPPHRGSARPLPPRDHRPRAAVVSAPAPAADVLGVPDRLDGPRPAERGVPGALQPLPLQPQARRHVERAGVVLRRRRRARRARSDRRARPRGARTARQPDLRRQLQPAAARRAGARRRQGDPGVRVDVPRHGLERAQGRSGAGSGTSCSHATSTACSSTR